MYDPTRAARPVSDLNLEHLEDALNELDLMDISSVEMDRVPVRKKEINPLFANDYVDNFTWEEIEADVAEYFRLYG